ncbi:MAG: hypothetical protein HFE04_00370 [Bacilli bacterium]|nr:hypothetical protein [Bacilli bacterium]
MKEIIKKKEIKGIFISILLILLSVFIIMRPNEIITNLIKVIGIVLILIGTIDFMNYFRSPEDERLINYGLLKGLMELSIGILFIFKGEILRDLFFIIIGLIIIFINVSKLQISLSLKEIEYSNWFLGVIISSLAIILGIVIILNPFETTEIVVITSGIILLISEISNIIYSVLILIKIRKLDKVVKEIKESE